MKYHEDAVEIKVPWNITVFYCNNWRSLIYKVIYSVKKSLKVTYECRFWNVFCCWHFSPVQSDSSDRGVGNKQAPSPQFIITQKANLPFVTTALLSAGLLPSATSPKLWLLTWLESTPQRPAQFCSHQCVCVSVPFGPADSNRLLRASSISTEEMGKQAGSLSSRNNKSHQSSVESTNRSAPGTAELQKVLIRQNAAMNLTNFDYTAWNLDYTSCSF